MINRFWFTKFAKRQIKKVVPLHLCHAFFIKIKGLRNQENLNEQLKPLKNLGLATHTLRVGNDRLILKRLRKHAYCILDIENLRDTWEEDYN